MGLFKFKGEIKQGIHTPLISKSLFNKVQIAFKKDNKPLYKKHTFLFGNFIECGDCGCSIIGEVKKGKYTYYHCTWAYGKDKCNNRKYYNETELLDQLGEAVKAIQIPKEVKEEILKAIIEINEKEQDFQKEELKRLTAQADKLRQEIRIIYQDKINGVISQDQWSDENEYRQQQLIKIKTRIDSFDEVNNKFMEEINSTLELLENTYDKYLQLSPMNKLILLKSLLSNCTLNDGKLSWTYKKPFCYLTEKACFEKIYP